MSASLKLLLGIALTAFALWAGLALWFDAPLSETPRALVGGVCALGVPFLLLAWRPFARAAAVATLLPAGVLLWWLSIPPSNERDWLPDVARLPRIEVDGDRLVARNVRNFHYRSETDFDPVWETRSYDLSKLRGVDVFLSYWGPALIAHTIVSWEFEDAPPLAISIETRKEEGESYSAVRGFFRQYELYYVVADERDVIGVRADHRGERVFLYRMRIPAEQARAILLQYAAEVERLAEQPRWYNALTHNCTTEIRLNAQQVSPGRPLHWKLLANGYLDELGYERGQIDTSLPFAELRARSDVTERAKAAGTSPDFSRLIRVGLPGAHAAPAVGAPS